MKDIFSTKMQNNIFNFSFTATFLESSRYGDIKLGIQAQKLGMQDHIMFDIPSNCNKTVWKPSTQYI